MPRCRSGKLSRYGDSMVRSRTGCRIGVARWEGDIAQIVDVGDAGPESWMTQGARIDASAA